jgi:pimeloyl-ACP methyl ester carboxylesterase
MLIAIIALAAVLLALHILMVIGVAEISVHPPVMRRPCDTDGMALNVARSAGAAAELVKIQSHDGLALSAWWLKLPGSAKVVLLCHGVADTAFGVMGAALLFLRNGCSVLLPDNRGHGRSAGFVTYGVREADDIARWQAWMVDQQGVSACYGFGESLGASSLLQSLSAGAVFEAVVAECPFSSFQRVAFDRVLRVTASFLPRPLARWLAQLWVHEILLYLKVRYRVNLALARPLDAIKNTNIPILLIHGTGDLETPIHHSEELAEANPSVQLWLVPGAEHTGGCAVDLTDFERRVVALFS